MNGGRQTIFYRDGEPPRDTTWEDSYGRRVYFDGANWRVINSPESFLYGPWYSLTRGMFPMRQTQ